MTLLILSCFVTGIPHRNPDLTKVSIGDEVKLVPEPTNQYDPLAIQVHVGSQFLGFVPREQTPVIHCILGNGLTITTEVMDKPMTKWKEVLIQASIQASISIP